MIIDQNTTTLADEVIESPEWSFGGLPSAVRNIISLGRISTSNLIVILGSPTTKDQCSTSQTAPTPPGGPPPANPVLIVTAITDTSVSLAWS